MSDGDDGCRKGSSMVLRDEDAGGRHTVACAHPSGSEHPQETGGPVRARVRPVLDLTPQFIGGTGVARYTRELHRGLRAAGLDVRTVATLRTRPPAGADLDRRVPLPVRVCHAAWRLGGARTWSSVLPSGDLFHSLDLAAPPVRGPLVVTVHDLAAIDLPHLHTERAVALQHRRLRDAHRADLVLAVSDSTAAALVRHGVAASAVRVTPLGTRLPVQLPQPATDLPARYVLSVGELALRKAPMLLVDAVAQTRDLHLVLAGPVGHGGDGVLEELARHPARDRVHVLGRVEEQRLEQLYAGALVFCSASLAEGFNIPVLEGMARGRPVLASDIPTTLEVGGDAVVTFPSGDADALARELEALADDPARRARLAAAGRERAAGLTWERCAAATAAAYATVLD